MDNEVINVKFYIEDDVLFKDEPIMGNHHIYYKKRAIITKDAFVALYKRWIEPEKEGESE